MKKPPALPIPSAPDDAANREQLLRYAEDLQQVIVRNVALETDCQDLSKSNARLKTELNDAVDPIFDVEGKPPAA